MSAKIIFIDGISGSGKDEQAPYVEQFFKERGYNMHSFAEPTPFLHDMIKNYRKKKKHLRSGFVNLHLFTADREEHFGTNIEPLLSDSHNVIITRRSKFSTEVYQVLEGVPLERVVEENAFYPDPDLALVFVCESGEAYRRIEERAKEKEKPISPDETIERISALREGYIALMQRYAQARLIIADGSPNAVSTQLESHLKKFIGEPQNRAVFFDKDGVLVDNSGIASGKIPKDEIYFDLTLKGLQKLQKEYLLFIVSNQPWAARGLMPFSEIESIFRSVLSQYQERGVHFTDFDYCPHDKIEGKIVCACHKPRTGLLERLIHMYAVDVSQSYMVGDRKPDIQAGRDMGLKTCLVQTGDGYKYNYPLKPDMIAEDVNDFAARILE
ncbi:MAG: HAD-IIIA family hydrolase [Nanoarchaeota archaeon]